MNTGDIDIQELIENLFETHYMRLRIHARRFLDNDADADDVISDVFFELWQNRHEIDFGSNILAYLYRATSTRSLNLLRNRGAASVRLDLLQSIDTMRLDYLSTENDQSGSIEQTELRDQINKAIEALPEKCREAFKLSYIHGMKNLDIADAMGISVRTVEAHIYKALRILREKLGSLSVYLLFFLTFSINSLSIF